jgi:ATP synthase subunit 6
MIFSPLEQFEIISLFPIRLSAFDLSFTNSSFIILLGVFILVTTFQLVTVDGNGSLVPNRYQTIIENLYEAVLGIVKDSIGEKASTYFPFIFALFSFILVVNLLGIVPYSFTVTSHLIVTITLALAIYIGKLILGFRLHGIKLFGILLPGGAPIAMAPFLVLIEFISFNITVVSLSVRLFANIIAGHILLKVLAGFAWTIAMAGGALLVLHRVPIVVLFILLGLELGVAIVQAYVFALLTCIYISDILAGGH